MGNSIGNFQFQIGHSFHGSTDAAAWSGINTSDIIDTDVNDMSLSMSMLNMSLEESQVCAVVCSFTQCLPLKHQERNIHIMQHLPL